MRRVRAVDGAAVLDGPVIRAHDVAVQREMREAAEVAQCEDDQRER